MKKIFIVFGLLFITAIAGLSEVSAYTVNYDSFEDAQIKNVNTTTYVFLNTGGDVDYIHYEIPAGGGGAYDIYSEYYSTTTLDVKATLYESQGILWWHEYEEIAHNDDGGTGWNFRITRDLDVFEDYYLKVTPYSTNYSGITKVTFEQHQDVIQSSSGGTYVADPHYYQFVGEQLKYAYFTDEQIEVYYYSQYNKTAWQEFISVMEDEGLDFALSEGLAAGLIALGIAEWPVTVAVGAIFAVKLAVEAAFNPSLEEQIVRYCSGVATSVINNDNDFEKIVSCNYGVKIINDDFIHQMSTYNSTTLYGVNRTRGEWFPNN